jgi:4-alpha-glucanotransferase
MEPANQETFLFGADAGVLLHPTSLPTAYGVGDFGPACQGWVHLLADSGQNLWQFLPLGPAGYGDSPYQGLSAFAANPVFLSPESMKGLGLLTGDEAAALELPRGDAVDYERVYANKIELSHRVHRAFAALPENDALRAGFVRFVGCEADWLDEFALFSAIKVRQGGRAWTEWPEPLRDRQAGAMAEARDELADDIDRIRLEQYLLFAQWQTVRDNARARGVRLVGDLPIFVAHDSSDVWSRRELFRLGAGGRPEVVAGVPPDYFSATGQLWGNPLYDWERHEVEHFDWWRRRMRKILEWVDVVRIDHFRGFAAFWEIPGDAATAQAGRWVEAPGERFFDLLVADLGLPLPVIAEDLGVITPDVIALRDRFHLPGIRIEQFAFGDDAMRHTFVPEAYDRNCVAYTGTHDNDTVRGWFDSVPSRNSTRSAEVIARERANALDYFGTDGGEIHWDFIGALYRSKAGAVVVPAQDVMGLGTEARMNTPGVASGSWRWRLSDLGAIKHGLARLAELTEAAGRTVSKRDYARVS